MVGLPLRSAWSSHAVVRALATLAALGLLAACIPNDAEFPNRPIDIITHASPGGGTDLNRQKQWPQAHGMRSASIWP